jgi:hypothetical protein
MGGTPVKLCPRCQETKPKSEFVKNRSTPDGTASYCKPCFAAYQRSRQDRPEVKQYSREWWKKNKDKAKVYHRRAQLKAKYGISIEDYAELLEAQNGKCAICESEGDKSRWGVLYVDHDHATGRVRALLCGKCNFAVGLLDDDVQTAKSLVSYLERFRLSLIDGGEQ